MQDVTIVINTLGRVGKQITWGNLPREIQRLTSFSVQSHEAHLYPTEYDLILLPDEIKDLPTTRQWLIDNVKSRYLIIMDDDLSFFHRKDDSPKKLYKNDELDTLEMFRDIMHELECGTAMVGISAREGNNHEPTALKYVGRSMRIFGLDLHTVREVGARFDRTKTKEDMDMTLQLLRAGYRNAIFYHWSNDHVSSNAPGGCASYRTLEVMKADAYLMQSLHPEFVKVVEKTTKTSWGGATRTDVVVQWKKAFQSSQIEQARKAA